MQVIMNEDEKGKIYNRKSIKKQRKYLRSNMTKAEVILWSKLKGRKLQDYKFRRQHSIGNYIVDFYCPKLKIALEIDGESHYTEKGKARDKKRSTYLNNLGISVKRFTNSQIKQNLNGVLKEITAFVQSLEKDI